MSGQRAVVSKGWGNIGADEADDPNVYFLGNCPHDWLFSRVSCVVHHGGAGTTATGLALGRPTVIVPFFGDQPFWGMLVASNGAGPAPIPFKLLTADKLAGAIRHCMEPEIKEQAKVLSCKIQAEQGAAAAMDSFHKHLSLNRLRCALCPDRPAVWRVQHTSIFLSAFAAAVLVHSKQLDPKNIKLYALLHFHGFSVDSSSTGFELNPTIRTLIRAFQAFPELRCSLGLSRTSSPAWSRCPFNWCKTLHGRVPSDSPRGIVSRAIARRKRRCPRRARQLWQISLRLVNDQTRASPSLLQVIR